uniref:Uncharacterized protein n=1 Tax=Culex tarsalis TaxID=7177 RepID=A0A1Q3FWY4_CULTA
MDEDVEFRDMVLKKLEENGSLLEIKAKLRAHLYDVIENDGRQHQEVVNDSDLTYGDGDKTDQDDGADSEDELDDRTVALSLVHDLLDCLKLPFSKRVLLAEAGLRKPCTRARLVREMGEEKAEGSAPNEEGALLLQLVERQRRKSSAAGGTGSDVSQVSRDQSDTTTATAMTPTASEESPAPA